MSTKYTIKTVKQAFIFYQTGTGQIIKLINIKGGNVFVDCAEETQVFGNGDGQTALSEFIKQLDEHVLVS